MTFSLIRSLVKFTIKHVGDGVTGGLIPVGSIAVDVYEEWCRSTVPAAASGSVAPPPPAQLQFRTELEKIAQDARTYRKQIEALLVEMNAGAAVRGRALAYLNQVPGRIQASMRRPEDPTGRTIPQGIVLRKADDLKQFLPDKMPRFKPGDLAVPGTDLIVEDLLGVGGFGEVWKAVHKERPHAPPVALKFCTDESAARSLRKEIELLDRVATQGRHKGIVELRYAHLSSGTPCLEYEFIEGGDLAAFITDLHRAGKAAPLQMTKILYMLALPVGHAHRLKPPIVHRDLKPQNILTMRADGKVQLKVADFGIGGIVSDQTIQEWTGETGRSSVTQSAGACTPLYASPQQRKFGPPNPRDDVYALGVIWFQMLSGDVTKEPPRGGSWKKKFSDRGATAEMIALLERCIEDDPAERPADAQVLAEELGRLIQAASGTVASTAGASRASGATAGSAPPAPPPQPAEQWYYARNRERVGPVSLQELRQLAAAGQVTHKDMVWTAKLGKWTEAGSIQGLCPELPPSPPPAPSTTSAHIRFIVPPSGDVIRDVVHTAAKAYVKLATYGLLGGKVLGAEAFKFYINTRLLGEGPLKEGFECRTELPTGRFTLEVAHWKGTQEIDRKPFDLTCASPGDYEIRFNYVKGTLGGMSGSTIEVLKDPDFPSQRSAPVTLQGLNPDLSASAPPQFIPAVPAVVPTVPAPAAIGTAQVRVFTPAGGFFRGSGFKGGHSFKVLLNARFLGESTAKKGFDFMTQLPLGGHDLVVLAFSAQLGELDRKTFSLECTKSGNYAIRFNYVWTEGFLGKGNMQASTFDILEQP